MDFKLRFTSTLIFTVCCNLLHSAHYRGLSVVNDNVAWMSGSSGTVLKTTDGGTSWDTLNPTGYENKDFRDIHAWDQNKAVIMSSGDSAVLLSTSNGGISWKKIAIDYSGDVFWDAFDVIGKQLVLLGDARYFPGDLRWSPNSEKLMRLPFQKVVARPRIEIFSHYTYTAFAASGSNIRWTNKSHFEMIPVFNQNYFQFISLTIHGKKHKKITEYHQSTMPFPNCEACGPYSFDVSSDGARVAVGGSYLFPDLSDSVACYSTDSGHTWQICSIMPRGYRSCVCALNRDAVWFCTGTNGTDISLDNGITWNPSVIPGYNVCAVSAHYVWLAGNKGSWQRTELSQILP